MFKLISIKKIHHRVAFETGPRITEIHTIQTPDGLFEVPMWTDGNGNAVKVGEPRKI